MKETESLSLGQLLAVRAKEVANKTAVVCEDIRKTYQQLNEEAQNLAAGIAKTGIQKGDRVAIYMKSSIEFVAVFYALQKLGVVVAWINPMYREAEANFIIKNSKASAVFIFQNWDGYDYLEAIKQSRGELPNLKSIFVVGDGQGEDVYRYKDLIATGEPCPDVPIDTKNDLAMLIYTSGTTGHPKGAMVTHYQSVKAGNQYALGVGAQSDDIFIGFLPMSHSYGCGSILIQPILLKSTVVLMDKFSPEAAFKIIEKEKITLQLGAPAHYIMELNHPRRSEYDLSSVRAGLIAGQPAPEGLITRVEKEMGIYLTSFLGASETGPGLAFMCPYPSPLDVREKYIGLPIGGTQARVVDPVTHETLPDGEVGEMALSGWHLLKGYWQNPEETAKQVVDGWLFMGDLVSRDENGYFRVFGRIKDMVNRGGYKIYPYELESYIGEHPKVSQVAVVGTPNPVLGESICVCVIPEPDENVTIAEIREFLKGRLAAIKLPDELMILDDFPKVPGGLKIKKFGAGGLTEMAENTPDRQRHKR